MPFPANTIDLSAIVEQTIFEMRSVRDVCTRLRDLSTAAPLSLRDLDHGVVRLRERRAALGVLEARVRSADFQTLRQWARDNLRNPDGTSYGGDYAQDFIDARNAIDAFLTWLQSIFPRSQNIIWEPDEASVLRPAPWLTASPEATELRTRLQTVIAAITM